MGTNCAPLIANLFLYCNERDWMSDLHKSKRHDIIDMFNDTSRYLDDIFNIDNPAFETYIPDIYPANTSDKQTSFLDLNIKVIGSDIHTSVYDKRDDFGFPIVNFPRLSGDVPRLPSYGIYILQLVRFARCCTGVLDFQCWFPELAFSRAEHSQPYSDVAKYIFDICYLLTMLFVYWFLWPLRLVWLLVCCLYKEGLFTIF